MLSLLGAVANIDIATNNCVHAKCVLQHSSYDIILYKSPVKKTLSHNVCSISVKYKFHQMITYYSQSLFTARENVLINHDELT